LENYFLLKNVSISHLDQNFLVSIKSVLNRSISLNTPSIQEFKQPNFSLPSWAMIDFVTELQETLQELNSKLSPVIYFTNNSNAKSPSYVPFKSLKEKISTFSLLTFKESSSFVIIGGKLNWTIDLKDSNFQNEQNNEKEEKKTLSNLGLFE
jgi:hypothetical protein